MGFEQRLSWEAWGSVFSWHRVVKLAKNLKEREQTLMMFATFSSKRASLQYSVFMVQPLFSVWGKSSVWDTGPDIQELCLVAEVDTHK